MYFLIRIRKKCRFTLATDSYKLKKTSDLCQMNYSTNENNTTSETPQSHRAAQLWQAKVSFPPPDCWCSSLLTLENSAVDWQIISLLWIDSGKHLFFSLSVWFLVSLLRISTQWANILWFFWWVHLLPLQLLTTCTPPKAMKAKKQIFCNLIQNKHPSRK